MGVFLFLPVLVRGKCSVSLSVMRGVWLCVCVGVCVCVSHCLRERIIYRGMSGDPGFSIWEFPSPLNHEDSRLGFLTTQFRLDSHSSFVVETRLTFLIACSWDEDSQSSSHAVEARTRNPHAVETRESHSSPQYIWKTHIPHHSSDKGLTFLMLLRRALLTTVQTRDSHSHHSSDERLTFFMLLRRENCILHHSSDEERLTFLT